MTIQDAADAPPKLRDPKTLWAWLRVLIVLYAIVSIALTAANALFLQLSHGDSEYTPTDAQGAFTALGLAGCGLIYTVLFVLCVIFTCRVTFRMMSNLRKLNSTYAEMSPGWAVGYYFVPFANLIMPMRAMDEIWKGTFSELTNDVPPSPKGAIGWWWGCWIAANLVDNVANRLSGEGFLQRSTGPLSPDQINAASATSAVAEVLTLLACVFMVRLFGKLANAQSGLAGVAALS